MKWLQALSGVLEPYWKFIQWAFVGSAFLLGGIALRASWGELSTFNWRLNYPHFAASLLLVSLVVPAQAVWWTLSVRLLGEQLDWNTGMRIWALAQLAKYLPGGIWNYVGRLYAANRVGVSKHSAMLSLVLETAFTLQAATMVFLGSLPFWPSAGRFHTRVPVIIAALVVGLLVVHPHILNWAMNLALRILKKPPVSIAFLSYRHILGLLVGHILTTAGAGGAFYLMIGSVCYVSLSAAVPIAGMLAISFAAGFLNPLTPHGLGTREGILAILLGYYLPMPAVIVVVLLCRVWLTLSEVLGVLAVTVGCRVATLLEGHRCPDV